MVHSNVGSVVLAAATLIASSAASQERLRGGQHLPPIQVPGSVSASPSCDGAKPLLRQATECTESALPRIKLVADIPVDVALRVVVEPDGSASGKIWFFGAFNDEINACIVAALNELPPMGTQACVVNWHHGVYLGFDRTKPVDATRTVQFTRAPRYAPAPPAVGPGNRQGSEGVAAAVPESWRVPPPHPSFGAPLPPPASLVHAEKVLTSSVACGVPQFRAAMASLAPSPDAMGPLSAVVLRLATEQPKGCGTELLHAFRAAEYRAADIYNSNKQFEQWCIDTWNDDGDSQPGMVIGWYLDRQEGGCTYEVEAGDWFVNRFGELLPPAWREYFTEVGRENASEVGEDGVITVPWAEVARRLAYWEAFREMNPGFELDEEAREREEQYASLLRDLNGFEPGSSHRSHRKALVDFLSKHKASRHAEAMRDALKRWK